MKYGRHSPIRLRDKAEFARLLRDRMRSQGAELSDLAKATGTRPTTVSAWLEGYSRPGGTNLVRIAALVDCEPEDLIPELVQQRTEDFGWLERERAASRRRMQERRDGRRPRLGPPRAPITRRMPELQVRGRR